MAHYVAYQWRSIEISSSAGMANIQLCVTGSCVAHLWLMAWPANDNREILWPTMAMAMAKLFNINDCVAVMAMTMKISAAWQSGIVASISTS